MIPRRSTAILALLLGACGGGKEPADTAQSEEYARAAPAPIATQGVDSAMAAGPSATPAPPAEARDTLLTPWRALDFPSEPWEQSAATPEALLQRVRDVVAAQLEEPDAGVLPTRMESRSANSAAGMLVHPDHADDSVRDVEFRLHMGREGSAWRVTGVDRRERCRRGVADGGLCA